MTDLNPEKTIQYLRELFDNGYRFYTEKDLDDKNTGLIEEISPGVYQVTTLRGLLHQAEQGLWTYRGETVPREVMEFFIHCLAFCAKAKRKIPS